MKDAAPSLVSIVVRRIMLFSALAMFAQLIGVVVEYRSDWQQLGRHAIQREAGALYAGVREQAGQFEFALPAELKERYGRAHSGYLARVRRQDGAVLFSNCDDECDRSFLGFDQAAPQFWINRIEPEGPLRVTGGRSFGPEPIVIDVAILKDTQGVLAAVLAHEVIDHMLLPMGLMLIVVLGATTLSISKALKPVSDAAELASQLDTLGPQSRLPTARMPKEIARFTKAVNASFDKISELVQAQKIFTSAISHEVRTPLAVARLELEKIADPRARNVERDLEALNRLVEQLTTLARLEGADIETARMLEPLDIAERVVSSLAPVVYESGRRIELIDKAATPFRGHAALVENALRNLVENAVRHTRPGVMITVEAGPGAVFYVRDEDAADGDRTAFPAARPEGAGLGLQIVRRIAEIHGGSFDLGPSRDGRGSTARLAFYNKPAALEHQEESAFSAAPRMVE